ncbi:MAG TPA: DUF2304 family protein [Actinomycetota bacterium]|jgi:hypothetical protein
MWLLRVLGAFFAVGFFALVVVRYERKQVSRLTLIISSVISVAILLLAIAPGLFNPLFETFNFQPGTGLRLTGVLLAAVVILFLLVVRLQSNVDTNDRSIRLLVESMGQTAFDWDAAAELPDGRRIVVISPALNEAENVGAVIHAMPSEVDGHAVVPIVIDDASDDGTADVARKAGALVASLPIRRGGGLALRVGYDVALKLDADVVVTIDADGQHQPEEIPILVKPILDGEADHVNGSRMIGDFERESLIRHLGVHFFSRVVTILTGQRVTDISSGYRATRADTLRRLLLEQDQFWTSEVTIEALRNHARVVEVPVTFLTRRGGESKKPKSLRYGWNFSKAIVKTWLR